MSDDTAEKLIEAMKSLQDSLDRFTGTRREEITVEGANFAVATRGEDSPAELLRKIEENTSRTADAVEALAVAREVESGS